MSPPDLIGHTGTAASRWQDLQLPPFAEVPPAAARLMVIAPHPDDEVLACGGLLAMHAAGGGDCRVLAVTDGEASDARAVPRDLAAIRRAERALGLQRLGLAATCVHRLGLPDGRVGQHAAALQGAIMALLRPGDWVVATWRHDGHPDHDAVGRAAMLACAAARCRLVEAPVWMWHWARPRDIRIPWRRLRALPLPAPAWRRKQAALAAHTSQLTPRLGGLASVLDDDMLARAERAHEYFFV